MEGLSTVAISDQELAVFCRKVERERNFDCSQFRSSYLRRRLVSRMRAAGSGSVAEYMALLDRSATEWNSLLNALTVNVTDFFRDASVWSLLRNRVVPELIRLKSERRQTFVRVWSAGCSSGQEPYSLAIVFKEVLGDDDAHSRVRITATDYDAESLLRAKRAVYTREQLAGLGDGRIAKCTEPCADDPECRKIITEVRQMVRFLHLDLFGPETQRLMDMVVCRNVMMYFNAEQQQQLLEKFKDSLVPGGFLVLGKSEKLPTYMTRYFDYYDMAERVYRKKRPEETR
ncbi:MAG: protein-glutamate O-methyltransferase CheR [Thermoleophilia bacterium]